MKRIFLIPYSFTLMNWAAVVALYYFARGRKDVWRARRRLQPSTNSEP